MKMRNFLQIPGNVLGKIGTATNITELKRAEAALRRSNAVLQAQQEASIDGILIISVTRRASRFLSNWRVSPSGATAVVLGHSSTASFQSFGAYAALTHPTELFSRTQIGLLYVNTRCV